MSDLQAKIRDQYQRTLVKDPTLATHLESIATRLGRSPDIFLEGFIAYDTDVGTYGNDIYAGLEVKAGMYFKYFIQESYQYERQLILADMVRSCVGIRTAVDVGFAVPGKYALELLEKNEGVHLTLLDRFPSSITFSEAVFSSLNDSWQKQVTLGTFDMDRGISPGSFDLYIFFDSLEHTKNPDAFLDTLVASAPDEAIFLFSLPVERVNISGGESDNPMHFIEFQTEDEIRQWLCKHGLVILREQTTKPTTGDFWLPIEGAFSNLIVKAKKTK